MNVSLSPYIGITDFTEYKQVKAMLEVWKKHKNPDSDRILHVGVMMSWKTLKDIPSRWSKAFPPKEKIAEIFASKETMNCLHFADYESDDHELAETIPEAISWGGAGMTALQLDMIWPDPGQVEEGIHRSRRSPEVILQIGRRAMRMLDDDPDRVARALDDYMGIVDRVLLDQSGGEGRTMNPELLAEYARAIESADALQEIGFAGGLGPETVDIAKPLFKEFPNASIDAQGRLRPSHNAIDPIDWSMAAAYLEKALAIAP